MVHFYGRGGANTGVGVGMWGAENSFSTALNADLCHPPAFFLNLSSLRACC